MVNVDPKAQVDDVFAHIHTTAMIVVMVNHTQLHVLCIDLALINPND